MVLFPNVVESSLVRRRRTGTVVMLLSCGLGHAWWVSLTVPPACCWGFFPLSAVVGLVWGSGGLYWFGGLWVWGWGLCLPCVGGLWPLPFGAGLPPLFGLPYFCAPASVWGLVLSYSGSGPAGCE